MMFFFVYLLLFGLKGLQAEYETFGNAEYFKNYDPVYGTVIDPNKIEDKIYPCKRSEDDWLCMRKFLASNSDCKLSHGPALDPLVLPFDKFFIPYINLTITFRDLEIRGFRDAKITEFYVNKDTGNLVIAINVRKLRENSPKTYFSYQRTGKESIILSDYTEVTYDSATFTAVIPKVPHLRLDRAEIHVDIHDSRPKYSMGPGLALSKDPDVLSAFTLFQANIPTVILEAYVFQSSLLASIFIQRNLCDFGLDSYGNYLAYIRTKGYTQIPSSSNKSYD